MAISKRLYRLFSGTYNSPARLNKVYHKRFSVVLVCVQSFVDNFRRLLLCPNPPPLEDNPLNPPYQGDGLALMIASWRPTRPWPSIPLIRGTA